MFLFHSILDAQKQFLKVFAGDWYEAHLEACKFVEQVYGVPISEPADVVIASCGGYPKDINIYQLQKTMDNAWCAVKDGGVIIILGECEEGSGSAALEKRWKKILLRMLSRQSWKRILSLVLIRLLLSPA